MENMMYGVYDKNAEARIMAKPANATIFGFNNEPMRYHVISVEEAKEICSDYVAYYFNALMECGMVSIPENMNTELFDFNEFEDMVFGCCGKVKCTTTVYTSPKIIYDNGEVLESKQVKCHTYEI